MAFDIDAGQSGSQGPWIAWSAKGTEDGTIDPRNFYLRDQNGKTRFDGFKTGVVFDLDSLKTGWQLSPEGSKAAPSWQFGTSPARLPENPGEGWKKGFQIRVAIGGGKTATWEQAGVGTWNALVELLKGIDVSAGKLPLVIMTGSTVLKFAKGSTVQPNLAVKSWVARPDCLKAGYQQIDDGNASAALKPAPQRAPDSARAVAADGIGYEDDVPF